jgi:hypothetical protein
MLIVVPELRIVIRCSVSVDVVLMLLARDGVMCKIVSRNTVGSGSTLGWPSGQWVSAFLTAWAVLGRLSLPSPRLIPMVPVIPGLLPA